MSLSAYQARLGRALAGLTARHLCDEVGFAPGTVRAVERGRPASETSLRTIRKALEDRGIRFPDDGSVERVRDGARIPPQEVVGEITGGRLAELRVGCGLSVSQLAAAAGVDYQTLLNLERMADPWDSRESSLGEVLAELSRRGCLGEAPDDREARSGRA